MWDYMKMYTNFDHFVLELRKKLKGGKVVKTPEVSSKIICVLAQAICVQNSSSPA